MLIRALGKKYYYIKGFESLENETYFMKKKVKQD